MFLHVHWSHISASVSGGTVTFTFEVSYAKGHNQAPFSAPVTLTLVAPAPTVQYQHQISEIQLSAKSPTANQLDTDLLEIDGLLLVQTKYTANGMTGATPDPFVHFVDIHYKSTGVGSKNKAPNFYA
jgi:hypothetical protein